MSAATTPAATARPPIHLIETEADRLTDLAVGAAEALPEVSELLLTEIDRAQIHAAGTLPEGVVSMYSTITFLDGASGKTREVQLVYPGDADIGAGRISILTPIGAGLIGLSKGQSILWPDRDGNERTLEIVDVRPAP